jgi:uncharacterized protein (TIGR03086 family)
MASDGFHRALDTFEGVLEAVDRWDAPTPCAGWTARDVAGHVIGGQHELRALATGEPPPGIGRAPGRFAGTDVPQSWRAARKDCAAALTPEALRRPIPFGAMGEVPLGDLLDGYILELLIHSWDLARAAGVPCRLDPGLVHHTFATAHVLAPAMRAAGLLAPPLPAPPGADELTRLLAFLGRRA